LGRSVEIACRLDKTLFQEAPAVIAQCAIQTCFSVRTDRSICVDFTGGEITSDAGLIALREFDHRIGFTDSIVNCLHDDRHQSYVVHDLLALIIQRLYGIVAGYEDQNDAHKLRHDGLFQIIAGKDSLGDPLASQSGLSRLENSICASEVGALNELLTESFIRSQHKPALLIIEVDSTDDPAHGQQQLIEYNGFYDQYMYHPLLIHEGLSGCLLGTFLRPGNAHPAENILSALGPIVLRLKAAFPHTVILLRADAGLAVPRLYEFCAAHDIGFTVAIPANEVFQRQAQSLLQQALQQYQATGEKVKLYGQFLHQAKSWPQPLGVLIKVEAGPAGTNTRFVVTNRAGSARHLFACYEGRGQAENYIKELKNQFKAHRLSCSRFAANALRLVLFALAYQLVNLFRQRLSNPELRRAQVQTLREKVFKVGALIRQSTRRFWLHLASGWPYQDLLAGAIQEVAMLPAPT
jgi:hypothetical protein